MSDDDDWFEAALRDDGESDGEPNDGATEESEDDTDGTEEKVAFPDAPAEEADTAETEPDADSPTDPATDHTTSDDATGDESNADGGPLFDDDFASAFASAPGGGGENESDFGGDGGFGGGGFNSGGFDAAGESADFGGSARWFRRR